MKLGQKIRYLRAVQGGLRGLGRPMTQLEVVQAMKRKLKKAVSQPYLSQIESGKRPHLTGPTRTLLARFFQVHPGFLVDDPPGFDAKLESDLSTSEGKLDVWFIHLAERFQRDTEVSEALQRIAGQKDTRGAIILLGSLLAVPGMEARVREMLARDRLSTRPRSGGQ
jgi:transcriptional regulator with XRE-family HTH domain